MKLHGIVAAAAAAGIVALGIVLGVLFTGAEQPAPTPSWTDTQLPTLPEE